jgi:hypothetical protein
MVEGESRPLGRLFIHGYENDRQRTCRFSLIHNRRGAGSKKLELSVIGIHLLHKLVPFHNLHSVIPR